jgi:hypothetical protein
MRKKLLFCLLAILPFLYTHAQVNENFSDGDFTNNPVWIGNTADWIVNPSFQLQSNNLVANAGYYLSTANTKATTTQWDFSCTITFNPSSANYVDVFLTASASDLSLSTTAGYFVRIGGTDDEVCLFRRDASGTVTKIIDGVNGVLNTSNNVLKITVVRNSANLWSLNRVLNGGPVINEGTVTDATITTSAFFGVYVKQSTASFFQRHFIDDIIVQDYVPDVTAPVLVSATPITSTVLDVLFNEPVDPVTSQLAANYVVNNGIGSPVTALRDGTNASLVHLTFSTAFPNRTNCTLTVNNVKDLAGNTQTNGTAGFSYFTAAPYDVVIDELMPDPTPQVQLPNNEWVELRNTTAFDINLQGWTIGDATGQSGAIPSYVLKADSFVVICTSSALAAMSAYGPAISVTSFPSLDNAGDLIYLRSSTGLIIHAVNYSDSWYQNELKKDGGWSLEMVDTKNPCSGISNWKASTDAKGGTPGKKNSVDAANADQTAPRLLRAYATSSTNVVLVFDESLDSTKAAIAASYTVSDGIGVAINAAPIGPLYSRVSLTLSSPLQLNKVYTVTAATVTDCSGNVLSTNANTARVGLPGQLNRFDIVVNEILFNPIPTSVDYVEIYNRSNKILNLKNTYLANRGTTGAIGSITQLSAEDYAFFPGDFMVATSNVAAIKRDFITQNPNAFIEISTPSYNDDKGNVIILNEQGAIIDEIAYLDDWHFPLISNDEGVSLERINYNDTSLVQAVQQKNWHSAASSVNYGTPTYKNSQFRIDAEVQGTIKVTPEIVSPDNDGIDDFATITYSFPEPGYVASITIFDAVGRPVRYLQRNALNGITGYYRWDGLGEKQLKLNAGIYVIYTEVFNLNGKTKRFKNTIVLARRH